MTSAFGGQKRSFADVRYSLFFQRNYMENNHYFYMTPALALRVFVRYCALECAICALQAATRGE